MGWLVLVLSPLSRREKFRRLRGHEAEAYGWELQIEIRNPKSEIADARR